MIRKDTINNLQQFICGEVDSVKFKLTSSNNYDGTIYGITSDGTIYGITSDGNAFNI